ncbi:flagellar export protein FliJ (plasmid) [Rossellomorea sp. AcN35-11]|nr:flagellar export protein FliJ [Rossellomorea aquimaris]WJV32283.1 flagellar export protein FliJ [Rossellomorea sp. AcN35-11]
MLASIKTFNKLIDAKEREKQTILEYYNELKERFDEAGNKLHLLMNKEEQAKEHMKKLIEKGHVSEIQKQTQFIQNLIPQIKQQENLYQQIKDQLHIEELKIINKNVEMKKFEKVKGKKIELFNQRIKEKESKEMDEISINQFMQGQVMA